MYKQKIVLSFAQGSTQIAIIDIFSIIKTSYKTGVEIEALTACSIAALTIYDMCKSSDKTIKINDLKLLFKSGGKSGKYENKIF